MKPERTRPNLVPDLSGAMAADIDREPVFLNGMRVVFDQRVAVYPVDLDQLTPVADDGIRPETD